MRYQDYYRVMGIPRDALPEDIRRAYRRLARKYHPDVSKELDGEERFKDLQEAYEVLKDSKKRAAYDRLGTLYQAGEEFRPPSGDESDFWAGGVTNDDAERFSDFFETLFGSSATHSQNRKFRDWSFSAEKGSECRRVSITLEEAFQGTVRVLQVSNLERGEKGTLSVKIPAGATQGSRIRLPHPRSQRRSDKGGRDLCLEIAIAPHPFYRLEGKDIYLDLPISPWEAALGAAKVAVPTLGGLVEVKLPAVAYSGQRLRLRGRGLPGNPPGDQYAILQIQVPPVTTHLHRELYERMAREMPFEPRANLGRS
ncbi:Curved DNA-binding protein [Gammaproteobacteria bacterium]